MPYFGSGSGATTFNQYASAFQQPGPTSYPTGGFVIDLTQTYSSLNSLKLMVKKGSRGSVGFGRFDVTLNSPANGKATITVRKYQQERVTSFDAITSGSQPSGVTVQTNTTGANSQTSSESSHTHDATHDHAAQTSTAMAAGGVGVDTNAAGPSVSTHTHSADPPSLSVTSGAGTAHNHQDVSLYDHTHSLTYTATNVTTAEISNGTNLSSTEFFVLAVGVRA